MQLDRFSNGPPDAGFVGLRAFRPLWLQHVVVALGWALLLLAFALLALRLTGRTRQIDGWDPGDLPLIVGLATLGGTALVLCWRAVRLQGIFSTAWQREIVAHESPNVGDRLQTLRPWERWIGGLPRLDPARPDTGRASAREYYAAFLRSFDSQLSSALGWILGLAFAVLQGGMLVLSGASGLVPFVRLDTMTWQLVVAGVIVLSLLAGLLTWRIIVVAVKVGQLARLFNINVRVGHADGCGGLEPLRNLYLANAFCILLPIGSYGLTLLVIGVLAWSGWQLAEMLWRGVAPFSPAALALMMVGLAVFWYPLHELHLAMLRATEPVRSRRARLDEELAALRATIADLPPTAAAAERAELQARLARLARVRANLEHIPTWPISSRTLLQLIPFVGVSVLTILTNALTNWIRQASAGGTQ
jgi:hypothetical protein